jgi:hypothetical protein
MKTLLGLFLLLIFCCSVYSQSTATVYFYRVKEVNRFSNKNVRVHINKKEAFQMPQGHFIAVTLKAGDYELKMEKKQSEMLLSVESGKRYFVRVSQTVSGYFYTESLTETAEKQAIYQMRDLPILEDKKLKNKDLIFVKEKPQ